MVLMQHTTDRDVPQNIAMQHPAISSKTRKEQARKAVNSDMARGRFSPATTMKLLCSFTTPAPKPDRVRTLAVLHYENYFL